MQLLRNTKAIMMVPQPGQENDYGKRTYDIARIIDWYSPVPEHSIRGKMAGKQSKNGTDSLSPHARETSSHLHDPEDLRALRDWVKAKRIHERQTEPIAAGFPALPWHCG
jgi:hypothetical protein